MLNLRSLSSLTLSWLLYVKTTGVLVMGVLNQLFSVLDAATKRWTGRYFWGISSGPYSINSLTPADGGNDRPAVLSHAAAACGQQGPLCAMLSAGESEGVWRLLRETSGPGGLHHAAGGGYKCRCVVLGLADVYVISQDSTYRWDTCSLHAILRSMGGGVACLADFLRLMHARKLKEQPELVYHHPVGGASGTDRWANRGGLVAYRSKPHLDAALRLPSALTL